MPPKLPRKQANTVGKTVWSKPLTSSGINALRQLLDGKARTPMEINLSRMIFHMLTVKGYIANNRSWRGDATPAYDRTYIITDSGRAALAGIEAAATNVV